MDAILEQIEASLVSVIGVESAIHDISERGLDALEIHPRIKWIERQLATLVNKLQAMEEDLNSGLSIQDMGFSDYSELQDFLQDLTAQISQLRSLAQSLSKGIGRDL